MGAEEYELLVSTLNKLPILKETLKKETEDLKSSRQKMYEKKRLVNELQTELASRDSKIKKIDSNIKEIKQKLLSKNSITKVEIFSKNHDQIYSILLMTQNIIYVLFGIVILFSLIILSKHIQIWFYEHHERISIMRLHGASTIYCAMPLINVAILSALFSSTIVIGITYYLLTTIDFIVKTPVD